MVRVTCCTLVVPSTVRSVLPLAAGRLAKPATRTATKNTVFLTIFGIELTVRAELFAFADCLQQRRGQKGGRTERARGEYILAFSLFGHSRMVRNM